VRPLLPKGQHFEFSVLSFRILARLQLEGNLHEASFGFAGVWLIPGLKGGGRNEAAPYRGAKQNQLEVSDLLALFWKVLTFCNSRGKR